MRGDGKNKHNRQIHLLLSEQEESFIRERMAESGIANLSSYLRKMAIDGYVIRLDMSDVRELIKLLRICSNNLNQYARRANEVGSVYAADVEDLRVRLDGLWEAVRKLLSGFSKLS